jgi:hypothetical protein
VSRDTGGGQLAEIVARVAEAEVGACQRVCTPRGRTEAREGQWCAGPHREGLLSGEGIDQDDEQDR